MIATAIYLMGVILADFLITMLEQCQYLRTGTWRAWKHRWYAWVWPLWAIRLLWLHRGHR